MTTGDLLCAIGEADERFVEEAGEAETQTRKEFGGILASEEIGGKRRGIFASGEIGGKRNVIVKWAGVAAMFFVAIGIAWIGTAGGKVFQKNGSHQEARDYPRQEGIREESAAEMAIQSSAEIGVEESAEVAVEGVEESVKVVVEGVEESVKVAVEGVEESAEVAVEGVEESVQAGVESAESITKESNGGFRSTEEEGQQDQRVQTVMISSFPGSSDVEDLASATKEAAKISDDKSVENGGVFLSPSLSGALEYYGDKEEYRYRVFVELFQDGQQIANDGDVAMKEVQRLAGLGYVVAMETCSDGEVTQTYFTLHATAGQVTDFVPDASIGYALWLYDERVEGTSGTDGTVGVWYGNSNAGMEGGMAGH